MALVPGGGLAATGRQRVVDSLIVGAATGFLVASVFVSAGLVMAFTLVRNSSSNRDKVAHSTAAGTKFVMPVVILAYPAWGAVGAVLGLVYEAATESAPGGGLGSPNQTFTIAVLAATAMVAGPAVLVFRRVLPGVLVITLAAAGIFGWLLPVLAE